ncbi:hypothetical protein [Stenomitos frigidus]|uniref:Uncharacterized protein n=1 Tax=Stenomitos frigidus ULC18 TaxID=2107698 RepID=A0A2T1E1N6_9CYAN|nr:hypothetical protein [Stenomitos frigidus]PSB26637.1 hypothetical protein C7B82_19220 [Stenomitos frigidus ULC18]
MEPILLFLDIDGVLSVSDTAIVDQEMPLDGSLVYPLPGARAFLQAINRSPWIQPLWLSSWGERSYCWNDWAATEHWIHAHPLPCTQRQLAQTQFQAQNPEAKYLSVRWHSRHWNHAIVWIEDGFTQESKIWADQNPKVRLIDTDPLFKRHLRDAKRGLRQWNIALICSTLGIEESIAVSL